MRLLFCCEFYHPSRGGVQEVMRQIAERMVAAGHDVTIATSYLPERKFASHNGVRVRDFRVSGNLVRGMAGELEQYRKFVREFDGDAILIKAAQQWTFDALWPVLDQIRARKVFIPCGFSGFYDPPYKQYFSQLPQVLAKFNHLIFYAEKYRDIDFARAHGLDHFSVLPNGASEVEFDTPADPKFRARFKISNDDFVFVTVGAPIDLKGHREVAGAFALIDTGDRPATLILNANWPLLTAKLLLARRAFQVLADEGWQGFLASIRRRSMRLQLDRQRTVLDAGGSEAKSLPPIKQSIRNANAEPNKRVLCTNLTRLDLVQAYMTADLFVFASNVEYSPLVLFEAAAAGTPFLSVPVGNAEEIARWTGGGIICPAGKDERGYTRVEPSVLAREMERCMGDPGMLARLGAAGKERWRRSFTWRVIAPQYEYILSGRTDRATCAPLQYPHNG